MLSTFSIAACDLESETWGVVVQSKFMAVGPIVPWAEPKVGAVATQASANPEYGPRGLEILRSGRGAQEVVDRLIADDEHRDHRQVGVIDARGRAAAFTGQQCYPWAGHRVGDGYTCQGNVLAGERVVQAMAQTFEETKGALPERLIAALKAAQAAGGDRRGQQSSALLVVKEGAGYGGISDRMVDLRVDDHPHPIKELERLREVHKLYFGETTETIQLGRAEVQSIQTMLGALGYYRGRATGERDEAVQQSLQDFHNMENLEMRAVDHPDRLDVEVYRLMQDKYRALRGQKG